MMKPEIIKDAIKMAKKLMKKKGKKGKPMAVEIEIMGGEKKDKE